VVIAAIPDRKKTAYIRRIQIFFLLISDKTNSKSSKLKIFCLITKKRETVVHSFTFLRYDML